MSLRRRIIPSLLPVLCLALSGCATSPTSLYIQPSNAADRAFSPPPPAVIRMPLKWTLPRLSSIPAGLTHWLDQQVHQLAGLVDKPLDLHWFHPALGKDSDLAKFPGLWENLQEPIFIDKDIWLLIRPEALGTGLVPAGWGHPLDWNVVLEMTAHPVVVFGKEPGIAKKPVPSLHNYEPGPIGFHAVGNTVISFREANRLLADPRTGLGNYPIPGTGSYHLRVKGVKLYGAGGQVIAQTRIQYNPLINVDGKPSQMTIYFRGVPRYDPAKETFYLKQLDFDVKTGDFLMRVASWILKSDILKTLRRKAHIPVGGKLDQLRERMNVVLNRPVGEHSRLVTHVDSFRILDAFVDQDGIQAQMSLDGTAHLDLLDH